MAAVAACCAAAALLALESTPPVQAQQTGTPSRSTVARLKDPQGLVLVSQGDALVAGNDDQRLSSGTRVITAGGAEVTITYDIGCDVHLKQNERFTVTIGPCAVLLAQVEALGPAPGAIGGGTGGVVTGGTIGATAAGAAAATAPVGLVAGAATLGALTVGAVQTFRPNPVSPN